jgi:hypothetical protein
MEVLHSALDKLRFAQRAQRRGDVESRRVGEESRSVGRCAK